MMMTGRLIGKLTSLGLDGVFLPLLQLCWIYEDRGTTPSLFEAERVCPPFAFTGYHGICL